MNAAFQGPSGRGSGPQGPRCCGQWLLQSEQFHQGIYTLFLVSSLGKVLRTCTTLFIFFFYSFFFFFNLTIVGLQCWASFSCITSDSFIVNCCKILTMVPCSNVSHSVMSDPMDCSQAPLSMEFSGREYWSGWPFASPMVPCAIQ